MSVNLIVFGSFMSLNQNADLFLEYLPMRKRGWSNCEVKSFPLDEPIDKRQISQKGERTEKWNSTEYSLSVELNALEMEDLMGIWVSTLGVSQQMMMHCIDFWKVGEKL